MAGDDKGVPVGALTGENRDVWTDVGHRSVFDRYHTEAFLGTRGTIGSLAGERQVVGADRVCCDRCLPG